YRIGTFENNYFFISIYGNDVEIPSVKDGPDSGDGILFKVWDHSSDTEYEVSQEHISFISEPKLSIPSKGIPVWQDGTMGIMQINITLDHVKAAFLPEKQSGSSPLSVQFKDISIGDINKWSWDFGDGFTSSRRHPRHTYFSQGQYDVSLHVSGAAGTDYIQKNSCIIVSAPIKKPSFQAHPTSGMAALEVSFQLTDTDKATSVRWIFGDQTPEQTSFNPKHTYNNAGEYTVVAQITIDESVIVVEKKQYIHVSGRRISGKITGNGQPLANALMMIWDAQNRIIAETFSDDDGQYVVDNLPAASGFIAGVWPSLKERHMYLPQFYNQQDTRSQAIPFSTLSADVVIDFALKQAPHLTIKGNVQDQTKGISNVRVFAFSKKLNMGMDTLSDPLGNYTLTGISFADDYIISTCIDHCEVEYFYTIPKNQQAGQYIPIDSTSRIQEATPVTPTDPPLTGINLIVYHHELSGRVMMGQTPVVGVWVHAWSDYLNTGGGTLTDEQGNYTITGLKPVSVEHVNEQGYVVEINHPGFSYQMYSNTVNPQNAIRVATGQNNIDFQLPSTRTISGTIRDDKGDPLSDVLIMANSATSSHRAKTLSDMNGSYTMVLPVANDYIVLAGSIEYPVMYYNQQSDRKQANVVNLTKGNVSKIDFIFKTGDVIGGRVFIEITEKPAPEGIWVNVWSDQSQTGGSVPTDRNGRFEIKGLERDISDYIIGIVETGYLPSFYSDTHQWENAEPVAPGLTERNLILKKGYSIKGCVLFNHAPYAGITVEAFSENSWGWRKVQSQNNTCPNFVLDGLPPGNYTVEINHEKFAREVQTIQILNISVSLPSLELSRNQHRISGSIHGLSINKKAQIDVWSRQTGCSKTQTIIGIGSETPYVITGLKPATDYRVRLYSQDHPNWFYDQQSRWNDADLVDISTTDANNIDFILSSSPKISGWLTVTPAPENNEIVFINAFSKSSGLLNSRMIFPKTDQAVPYSIEGMGKSTDIIVFTSSDRYKTQYYDYVDTREMAILIDTTDDISDTEINFYLDQGTHISGTIQMNKVLLKDAIISAWSDSLQSGGKARAQANGQYLIQGLSHAEDYIVHAKAKNTPSFYYNGEAGTQFKNQALFINTMSGKIEDIDITIVQGDTISGIIWDQDGKGLANIWVRVYSPSLNNGNGIFSNTSGHFEINGLVAANDYEVDVYPYHDMCYVPQKKNNVSSNSEGVNFQLTKGYQLSGTLTALSDNSPVSKTMIEVISKAIDFHSKVQTNGLGQYNICGLPASDDYVIMVLPQQDSPFMRFIEKGVSISQDMTKDMNLSSGFSISGHIYIDYIDDTNNQPYTSGLWVSARSSQQNVFASSQTDQSGYYIISNLPDATDYVLRISPNGYGQQKKYSCSTGNIVNFILEKTGCISGTIKDVTGNGFENVRITAYSQSFNFGKTTRSASDGSFVICGLKNTITDFIVKAFTSELGYPAQTIAPKRVGDIVHFTLIKNEENTISGSIVDSSGNSPPESVLIMAFDSSKTGPPVKQVRSNIDGTFTLTGLSSDRQYQLLFDSMGNSLSINPKQWAGENDIGVPVSQKEQAKMYNAGDNIVFQFDGEF
ncbi:PKD domain protein, partial [Candidatus Magnetomorum sp. HK-1]